MTASGDSEGLRVSPHIYNSMDQIDRVVAAVRELTV
jgi:selenocysteine lyase/cysteine desulfurase